jgi:hypothetical protein
VTGRTSTRLAVLLLATLAAAAVAGGGPVAASTARHCTQPDPQGRLFCVTIEDLDGVSPSGLVGSGLRQVDVEAYHFYKLAIENLGDSTLTNGIVKLVLTDRLSTGGSVGSTAAFLPSGSAAFCSSISTSPNTVACSVANLPAGTATAPFTVAYRTSTTPNVSATDASVTVELKEGENSGANPASLAFVESTSLEPNPDASVAWSPPGQTVSLGTSPFETQFSDLEYTVPVGKTPFVARLSESGGYSCDPSLRCFGQLVTTDLTLADPTTFSASNPFHLTMGIDFALVPGGNTNRLAVSHRLQDGTFEVIRTRCSANPPAPKDALPCITTLTKIKKEKLLVVDLYAFRNGGWMVG